jgi:hypothetical protein
LIVWHRTSYRCLLVYLENSFFTFQHCTYCTVPYSTVQVPPCSATLSGGGAACPTLNGGAEQRCCWAVGTVGSTLGTVVLCLVRSACWTCKATAKPPPKRLVRYPAVQSAVRRYIASSVEPGRLPAHSQSTPPLPWPAPRRETVAPPRAVQQRPSEPRACTR